MKLTFGLLVAMSSVLFIAGCPDASVHNPATATASGETGKLVVQLTKDSQAIPPDGLDAVKQDIAKRFVQFQDGWATRVRDDNKKIDIITYFKSPLLAVESYKISKADKLNGIAWHGQVTILPEAGRRCTIQHSYDVDNQVRTATAACNTVHVKDTSDKSLETTWDMWRDDYEIRLEVSNTNGQWRVEGWIDAGDAVIISETHRSIACGVTDDPAEIVKILTVNPPLPKK
ncbi:MAG: hypothetical protein EHM48_05505 [Planctomycetaceae bacterium]|nr:MAG: hypothetical protein EHM48_05505 [Planctomycetaceae bacterium]